MHSPIILTGRLHRDAQHRRRSADAGNQLSFELTLPSTSGRPMVARVVLDYGAGEAAAYATSARAKRWRAGVRMTVHAQAADHHRDGIMVLHRVQHIEELDLALRPVAGADT